MVSTGGIGEKSHEDGIDGMGDIAEWSVAG